MDQNLKDVLKEAMLALALKGENITAIKLYKDRTGCDLKEAKGVFEEIVKQYFGTKFVDRKITITLEPREDGGLYVYSDDVPGLILSHSNQIAVLHDIVPALITILEYRKSK